MFGRLALRLIMPVYRLSFNARHRALGQSNAANRRSLLGRLTGRWLVHATVIGLTISVGIGNLSARGAGLADIAQQSVLSKVLSPNENDEEVVERATPAKVAYVTQVNAISPDVNLEAELGTDGSTDTLGDSNALQIGDVSSDGVAQRTDVTTYVVLGGDTLGGIANRFGVTQGTIRVANNLADADFIKPGQELLIPPITGVLHKVVKGDTIASIAAKYKVAGQDILDFNHLADPSAIGVDQTLIVPGGEIPDIQPERFAAQPSRPTTSRSTFSGPIPAPAPAIRGGKLNWPTVRRGINQYFRYGHTGIDAECSYGNPLYAARDGVVSAVIYQKYGYGYHVIIDHGGGFQTLYGHASKIFVKPGQRVSRGGTIAMCGSTGRSSGTHVHFETIVNGRKVNPLTYL